MAGEKIHMLHGAIGSQHDWLGIREYLERKYFLTEAHDLYHYLKREDVNFSNFSRSFIENLPKLEKNQSGHYLLGYSLGGRLALHALLEQPAIWRKAVIVSAHTGMPDLNVNERLARIKSDERWSEMAADENLPWSEFLTKWNQQGVLSNSSDQCEGLSDRVLLESVRREIARSFRVWSLGLQDDLLEKMSSLTTPVLWVVGERDHKFLDVAKLATAILPNAELRIIKNAGHRVPWEQAKEFHSLVSEWFSE